MLQACKLIPALLIIAGTYLLSRSLFKASIQRLGNFTYGPNRSKLPFVIRFVIVAFGFRRAFYDGTIWQVDPFPSPSEEFSGKKIYEIGEPFIGFALISTGTILSQMS